MNGAPLLKARGLDLRFPVKRGLVQRTVGYVHAVRGVDFSLAQGKVLGIVGESGSGKSSLAKILVGLHVPCSGTVEFNGTNIFKEGRMERSFRPRIQMVFQDPFSSLNPRQSVASILEEPLTIHRRDLGRKARREWIDELLVKVGLNPSHAALHPHQFSGGQRQRIAIARALALTPDIIIADEPVSALDVSIQAQILNLFEKLRVEFGLSYLFISHNLGVVRHISDDAAVMYLGKILERGPRDELFSRYKHPYTQALLSAVPRVPRQGSFAPERIRLNDEHPDPTRPPPGCAFSLRCPYAEDRCRREEPALRAYAEGHEAACHYPIGD